MKLNKYSKFLSNITVMARLLNFTFKLDTIANSVSLNSSWYGSIAIEKATNYIYTFWENYHIFQKIIITKNGITSKIFW